MTYSIFKITLISVTMIACGLSSADEGRKLPRIGVVWFSNPSTIASYDIAFRDGLRERGYVDGKNVTILARYANGDVTQVPIVLEQLIAVPVNILVVSPRVVQVATQKTTTIPIVCPDMGNPLRDGLVASLAHPGGNLTGGYGLDTETTGKRLELTMELAPLARNIGAMFDASDPSLATDAKTLRELAQSLGVTVRTLGVRDLNEIQAAISTIDRERIQALIIFDTPFTELHMNAIMRLTAHRLPVVSDGKDWARAGALLTYGANWQDMWKRSAIFVDEILKGAKPGNLPIEQPTRFDLVVNMRTAKALGITVPESILLRADEVIR